MLESIGNGTKEGKMYKHVQSGDATEYQRQVDRWRRFNGLEAMYNVEKEKQEVTHG
jgi:hypothetical protein